MDRPKARMDPLLLAAVALGGALVTVLALVVAPSFVGRAGFTAPLAWKLFFFHVPVALVSFIAFAVALVASVQYLRTRRAVWDRHALAAVEVGVLLTALTLVTGMLWGHAEWGVAWRWSDAKLVVVLVLFLVYVAYLLLRREIPNPETRRRVAAVYAIAGFATVPLAYAAQRVWASFHPTVFGTAEGGITTPGVMPIFLMSLAVFTLVYAAFHVWRVRILEIEAHLDRLEADREAAA
jgi:heme exporter protein C